MAMWLGTVRNAVLSGAAAAALSAFAARTDDARRRDADARASLRARSFGRGAHRQPLPMQLLEGAVSAATAYTVERALRRRHMDERAVRRGRIVRYAAFGTGLALCALALRRKTPRPTAIVD